MKSARPTSRVPRLSATFGIAAILALGAGSHAARAQTLTKTAVLVDSNGNGFFDIDETIQYQLVFTNTSGVDLVNAIVQDTSSSCVQLDSNSVTIDPPDGSDNRSTGNSVDVAIRSPLPPGESVTIAFLGTSRDDGECCNQATWTADSGGGLSDRDSSDFFPDEPTCHFTQSTLPTGYDAFIDKQAMSTGCLAPGSEVEFRVRIRNSGTRPLRRAQFRDVLAPGFGDPIIDGGNVNYDPVTRTVSTSPGTWGVGQEAEFIYRVTLPCTSRGMIWNTAQFTFEDNAGNSWTRSDTASVRWGQPDFAQSAVTWTEMGNGDGLVTAEESVRFDIVVSNEGGCGASEIIVTNQLDPRFISDPSVLVIDGGGTYSAATGIIEWNSTTTPELLVLSGGGTVNLGFTTRVAPSTAGGQYIPNTVTIQSDGVSTACPGLPGVSRTISLRNGDVAFGAVVPPLILLRNDAISCLASAFYEIRSFPAILLPRPAPQHCSTPPAIQDTHPQTDMITNPESPYRFTGDAAFVGENCTGGVGSGRVLVFYELQDECITSLRVQKDPLNPRDVLVTW